MINCHICEEIICKYKMDLEDTIILKIKKKGEIDNYYVCDECAREISIQLINR